MEYEYSEFCLNHGYGNNCKHCQLDLCDMCIVPYAEDYAEMDLYRVETGYRLTHEEYLRLVDSI